MPKAATARKKPLIQRKVQIPEAFSELFDKNRYKVFWGGRGAGKSWAFADALLIMGSHKKLRIMCAREIQRSIKQSVYSLLAARIEHYGLGDFYRLTESSIKGKNGTEFIFTGLWANIENMKSTEAVDICWVEEAASVSEESWHKLVPTIRKPGSEIWASFNAERKSDAAYQRFIISPPKGAIIKKVSWRDNPYFTDEMAYERDQLKLRDEAEYNHVWEGQLRVIAEGAIYGKQLRAAQDDGRITSVPHQKGLEVHTAWDLGRNDLMAIWFFQTSGGERHFIDYYENRLQDLDHYAKLLKDKDYVYGTHYLPHDGDHIVLGANNKTRKRILEDLGIKPIVVVPRIRLLQTGIDQTKEMFSVCRIDENKCERGLECLGAYSYKWNAQENAWSNNVGPKWASNAADAFRQVAQGFRKPNSGKVIQFPSEWR